MSCGLRVWKKTSTSGVVSQLCDGPADSHVRATWHDRSISVELILCHGHTAAWATGAVAWNRPPDTETHHRAGPLCLQAGHDWHDDGCLLPITDRQLADLLPPRDGGAT